MTDAFTTQTDHWLLITGGTDNAIHHTPCGTTHVIFRKSGKTGATNGAAQ